MRLSPRFRERGDARWCSGRNAAGVLIHVIGESCFSSCHENVNYLNNGEEAPRSAAIIIYAKLQRPYVCRWYNDTRWRRLVRKFHRDEAVTVLCRVYASTRKSTELNGDRERAARLFVSLQINIPLALLIFNERERVIIQVGELN